MKDKEETKIKKIVLSIEGKELVLSVEGAKELKTLLNDLFGREVVKEHHYRDYYRPWHWGYSSGTAYLGKAIGGNNSLAQSLGNPNTNFGALQGGDIKCSADLQPLQALLDYKS